MQEALEIPAEPTWKTLLYRIKPDGDIQTIGN